MCIMNNFKPPLKKSLRQKGCNTMSNILEQSMAYLATCDAELAAAVQQEYARQWQNIELIVNV